MHYYQFNISDWALHTSHLTLEEEAVYRRLLDFYYDSEKPIPEETQPVIRRLRLVNHSDIFGLILAEFFHLEADGWHNHRADLELKAYHHKADMARSNGKKGGRPKKRKPVNTGDKNPAITQSVNSANPDVTQPKPDAKLTKNYELGTINQELRTSNQVKDLSANADVLAVFDYWRQVMGKNKSAKLTPKRKSVITARLKDGYTIEQIKQGIDGCSRSDHHMGKNNTGTKYDDIELICRTGEKLEQFGNNIGVAQPVSSDPQNLDAHIAMRTQQLNDWQPAQVVPQQPAQQIGFDEPTGDTYDA